MTEIDKSSQPSLVMAIMPIAITLCILAVQLFIFNDFTPHIPLVIGISVTAFLAWLRGYRWHDIEDGILHTVRLAMQSLAILMLVGMIVGIWIASGTVPLLIQYGLTMLNPQIFLAASMLLCAVVSLSLGTSWGTVSTVGLALVGIGVGFDIPIYWTAGAVVSGAFFGDKMSPLSDTTNLAPAVIGVDLFQHIKNMLPTTIPAMLIAFSIYLFVGLSNAPLGSVALNKIELINACIAANFNLSAWLLIPPVLVLTCSFFKLPTLPSLFIGVVSGALIANVIQDVSLHELFRYAQSGYQIETGVQEIDSLLARGGIQSMTWVITLIMISLGFGGALERTRCLETIVEAILSKSCSFFRLQASAIGTSVATNLVAGDPYLSISLPGRMFVPVYEAKGYSKLNLSRAVEEGGTLISPLVPWNAGGAVVISALGLGIAEGNIENLLYIPLAFACWISPVISLIFAATDKFILREVSYN
ncbi:Na+/H+ antiporter NhaC [Vibrio pectenicida]|uniref:Na+/H+ antiporter NhaC n=1 Tax=Vibrio pectenicida TaxID=62763 RepID=UPI00308158EF